MKISVTLTLLAFYLVAAFYACNKTKNEESNTCKYAADIKPIVIKSCAHTGCHGAGSAIADITQYSELKKRAKNGVLQKNVLELGIMPPTGHDPLTTQEKDKLKCWLDNDAPQD
ncbi:MAG: hypothetical protein KF744_01690 [Taibaiella sp.]|nr:hypothetical protein [Taibaiella sp.]